ncbi:MAG: hypothetical protein Q7T71_03445 [Herbiconiux sp.]|nr:hypothetical protein [Herbiconiux sp.]
MTNDTPPEAEVDVARLVESLRQCQQELADLRHEQEVREERLAPLEQGHAQLQSITRLLDRHLTKAEQETAAPPKPQRRRLFPPRPTPEADTTGGPDPSEVADLERIRASPLFDGAWYLQTYPKVIRTGLSPALHYLRLGADQLKDPGPHFSVGAYLRDHPDVPDGTNHLLHYLDRVPGVAT